MSQSCGHKIVALDDGRYRLLWVVTPRIGRVTLPPRLCHRDADRASAERFSERWAVPGPWAPTTGDTSTGNAAR